MYRDLKVSYRSRTAVRASDTVDMLHPSGAAMQWLPLKSA